MKKKRMEKKINKKEMNSTSQVLISIAIDQFTKQNSGDRPQFLFKNAFPSPVSRKEDITETG